MTHCLEIKQSRRADSVMTYMLKLLDKDIKIIIITRFYVINICQHNNFFSKTEKKKQLKIINAVDYKYWSME